MENLYEDPTLWDHQQGQQQQQDNAKTPTMLKKNVAMDGRSGDGGLLVTSSAHTYVGQPGMELLGSATYQANSTDSGCYSQRSNVGDYAEDIYDYPAAFQQMKTDFQNFAIASSNQNSQDGIYDTVPGLQDQQYQQSQQQHLQQCVGGDYDFVDVQFQHQHQQQQQQSQQQSQQAQFQEYQLGDYDTLPSTLSSGSRSQQQPNYNQGAVPVKVNFEQHQATLQQQLTAESMETLPEFTQAECEKTFECRRNVIERLVRYEHSCTRAATRWAKLFSSSGWRKGNYLKTNCYAIRSNGEQLAQAMTTFASFAAATLTRLDFATFSTPSNLRAIYEPLSIDAQNFKKYLVSVGLVNWSLANAVPHLAKTLEVMQHSQRSFLQNLANFANILKRADFTTIRSTSGSNLNLSEQQSLRYTAEPPTPKPPQQRNYIVMKDLPSPQPRPPMTKNVEVPIIEKSPQVNRRGMSSVHMNITGDRADNERGSNTGLSRDASSSTLGRAKPDHQQKSLRFADDVELLSQSASDLEQRISELSFVVSTFVLSLRRTQPSAQNKMPDMPEGMRFNGGFIECGKLLVNVAHSVVLLGDKLASIVPDLERSEAIKASADRLRVCIRVFVEKLKGLAGAGTRSTSAVDDLITHVEVLRSQAETIRQRLGPVEQPPTPTATLSR